MTQLRSGTIVLPVAQSSNVPEGQAQVWGKDALHCVFRSDDGGRTWPHAAETHEGCYETHILESQNGDLLAALRYQRSIRRDNPSELLDLWADPDGAQVGAPLYKRVFLADSTDQGATWSNLRGLMTADEKPVVEYGQCHGQLVQVPDGRVVLVHDNRYPGENAEVIARVSGDNGQTWQPQAYHVSFGMGYPASVVLDDGTIVTVTGNTPMYSPQGLAIGDHTWSVAAIRWRLP